MINVGISKLARLRAVNFGLFWTFLLIGDLVITSLIMVGTGLKVLVVMNSEASCPKFST